MKVVAISQLLIPYLEANKKGMESLRSDVAKVEQAIVQHQQCTQKEIERVELDADAKICEAEGHLEELEKRVQQLEFTVKKLSKAEKRRAKKRNTRKNSKKAK